MNRNDPRSYDYKRIYNKEPINIKKLVFILSFDFFISLILYIIFNNYIYITIFNCVYLLICLKYILIFLIKLYQKIAPINIRDKCRFEPSCSNYMLQCLEKYGLIKGLIKGINRLKRCNINNGGYDYP